jgi:dephospho-CoA kinase
VRSVAVTGNIASGKSTVARLFESWGADRIDADALTRELQSPGTPVFQAIVGRFGPSVVAPDGALDRAWLRKVILADPAARIDLNAIVHPAVFARIGEELAASRARDRPVVVVEVPLLFETGTAGRFDQVVLVEAPREQIIERLVRIRGLDPETARRFLDAQAPADSAREQSDFVIRNEGSLEALEREARAVWRKLANDV